MSSPTSPSTENVFNRWTPLPRNYNKERELRSVTFEDVEAHPLVQSVIIEKSGSNDQVPESNEVPEETPASPTAVDMFDPLRSSPVVDDPLQSVSNPLQDPLQNPLYNATVSDPLSNPLASTTNPLTMTDESNDTDDLPAYDFEFWVDKCPRILNKYTTSVNIAVDNSFLNEDIDDGTTKEKKEIDQVASRLEEFENASGHSAQAKSYMSQKDFITKMEDQHKKLKSAWDAGERVVSLRIAIQCAKFLEDMTVPAFYPSMFVILTRILDTFGDLVFNRIKERGIEHFDPVTNQIVYTSLPANFKASDVAASAKETCKNWFFKTTCIRELLPRFYIDLALIKCYRFLEDDSFAQNLNRLTKTIRGIGDPLTASYARAFMVSKALDMSYAFVENAPPTSMRTVIASVYKKAVFEAFDDQLFMFKAVKHDNFAMVNCIRTSRAITTAEDYVDLFSPAFEWIIQNTVYRGDQQLWNAVIEQYKDSCGFSVVLQHIISLFPPRIVANNTLTVTSLIKECTVNKGSEIPKLYLALVKVLVKAAPLESERLMVLNDIWKVVTKIDSLEEYMQIATVFVNYILCYFKAREVNIFLKDVIKHVKVDDETTKLYQNQLESIAVSVMEHSTNINDTLTMDYFLPLLDLLDKQHKVAVGKLVLSAWNDSKQITGDAVIVHTLSDIGKAVHDSVNALSLESATEEVSTLLVGFVRSIDFGLDLEQQLNIMVDLRASLTNLDTVTAELVQRVAVLANKAHQITKGRHTKKTVAFVKAALAYCHITIPSLQDSFVRLHLYSSCAEVALTNQMIVQAEAFVKAAIALLPLVPAHYVSNHIKRSTSPLMHSFVMRLASFLLYFPGHPEQGPFHLAMELWMAVDSYQPWITGGPENSNFRMQTYMGLIRLFVSYAQLQYPFTINRVESNDTLYAASESYIDRILVVLSQLVERIVDHIQDIGTSDIISKKTSGTLALDMVNTIATSFVMDKHSATLIYKLMVTVSECGSGINKSYYHSTFNYIRNRPGKLYRELAKKIVENDSSLADL